ncbi:unnamed protein product, partial [Staurois parvus]
SDVCKIWTSVEKHFPHFRTEYGFSCPCVRSLVVCEGLDFCEKTHFLLLRTGIRLLPREFSDVCKDRTSVKNISAPQDLKSIFPHTVQEYGISPCEFFFMHN